MEKSQPILGLRVASSFSIEERRLVIEDYLTSGLSKLEIWKKHTGQSPEAGRLLAWMRELGYDTETRRPKRSIFRASNYSEMSKSTLTSAESFQLKQKIAELEKALINSELRSTAYQTAIEIAEKELKISILKKSNTKPSIK
jgi:hypothetical protein